MLTGHFHTSKARNEALPLQSLPPTPPAEMIQQAPPPESSDASRDNIEELVYRLNRAMANLPPPGSNDSSTTAPPRYEHIA